MQNKKGSTSVIVSFIVVVGVIILLVWVLSHKRAVTAPEEILPNGETSELNTITTNPEASNKPSQKPMDKNTRLLPNFTPVSRVDALQKIDVVAGTGKEAPSGATVSVHYTGAVAATGAIFQSSKDFGSDPITFPLSGVIKGWTEGIPGMKVGGTRRLVIPAAWAYGATPPPGSGIPPNADLVFDVELVAVK